jgi:hypothetical protein
MALSLNILNQNKIENMATSYEIKFINESNQINFHDKVKTIGGITVEGIRWKITAEEAICGIESNQWRLHINEEGNSKKIIITKNTAGNKCLKPEVFP